MRDAIAGTTVYGSGALPSIADFGITGVAPVSRAPDKNSTLKLCIIKGPARNGLVYRLQPNHPSPTWNCWPEKVLFDAIRDRKGWVVSLCFHDRVFSWYDHDVPQQNDKGFFVRLFPIFTVGTVPSKQQLLNLGRTICDQLNRSPGNNTTTTVDEESYFWLGGDAVWSDILGSAEALTALFRETNTTFAFPGFYEANAALIHSYFHEGRLTQEIARTLHAPGYDLSPAIRDQDSVASAPDTIVGNVANYNTDSDVDGDSDNGGGRVKKYHTFVDDSDEED